MVFYAPEAYLYIEKTGRGISFCVIATLFSKNCVGKREGVWEKMSVEEGQVLGVHTVEAWNEHLQKGNESNKLVCCLYH